MPVVTYYSVILLGTFLYALYDIHRVFHDIEEEEDEDEEEQFTINSIRNDVIRNDVIRNDVIRNNVIRNDVIRNDPIRNDPIIINNSDSINNDNRISKNK